MAVAPPQYAVHRTTAIEYQPLLIDGERVGEAHQLRAEGSHGSEHEACLWRTDAPARYDYFFYEDESFYVLEGSVSIDMLEVLEGDPEQLL